MEKKRLVSINKVFISIILIILVIVVAFMFCGIRKDNIPKGSIVYIVPIYGQSLALGEEANLVTNISNYGEQTGHRIKSEFFNERIGYYSENLYKQRIKNILGFRHRHFESSVFGLGECFTCMNLGDNVYLCTFIAGQGETDIAGLGKGAKPYKKFINEIKMVYEKASSQGAKVLMPAFCWMQGEDDLVWNTKTNYAELLMKFRHDVEHDVRAITHQKEPVDCILYQTCCLTLAKDRIVVDNYICPQIKVPEAQRELIVNDKNFYASGPVYPYDVVREYAHIDGFGQKQMGWLEGLTLDRILKGEKFVGLQPNKLIKRGDTLIVRFDVPVPPLILDTISVTKVNNYGFSVVDKSNHNILHRVIIKKNSAFLICSKPNNGSLKVRYGVCGNYMKSGRKSGPRGNLRDSQGSLISCKIGMKKYPLNNWCYMFEFENR